LGLGVLEGYLIMGLEASFTLYLTKILLLLLLLLLFGLNVLGYFKKQNQPWIT
jgi:hypothetical protein